MYQSASDLARPEVCQKLTWLFNEPERQARAHHLCDQLGRCLRLTDYVAEMPDKEILRRLLRLNLERVA